MNKDILSTLRDEFISHQFELERYNFGGVINTFFVYSDSEASLSANWEKIRNRIAVYFQAGLKDEFSTWNIYIFFISPQEVGKNLKFPIEHDTLSSRKIVIDKYKGKFDKKSFMSLFDLHIGNTDIRPNAKPSENMSFVKDKEIFSLVSSIEMSTPKKIRDEKFGKALQQLASKLEK